MKKRIEHDFDTQMRRKFDDYNVEVSPALWGKITEELDAQKSAVVRTLPVRAKSYRTWWAAAALVLCGSFGWWMVQENTETVYLQAFQQEVPVLPSVREGSSTLEVMETVEETKQPMATNPTTTAKTKHTRFAAEEQKAAVSMEQHWKAPKEIDKTTQFASVVHSDARWSHKEITPVASLKGSTTIKRKDSRDLGSFSVSNMLNFVVAQVDKREEKLISFSDNEEGSILIDFNLGLARTN